MELYEGVAILATNMRQQMDEAFVRRLTFQVGFPAPDPADRERIWQTVWPPELPRSPEVDFGRLAQFKFTGGNIKNVVLAAASLAASEDNPVTMAHLLRGVSREYQKVGKQMTAAELNGHAGKLTHAEITM
jgi:SpoVK/Ycf46/Vps4 family AAA+-type ATPase